MSFDLNSEFIAQFLNMQMKALGLGSMQDALTSILYIGTHFEHNLQPGEIINSSRLLPSLQMSPIYLILKNIKNARSNFTTIPKKLKNMNFQFLNRTSPSSLEDFDRNGTISRQIENLYRLSNVYQFLTMRQQLPSLSHSRPYPSWSPFIPVSRETVSQRESLSSDRSSKSPKSENDSESSKQDLKFWNAFAKNF